MFVAVSIFNAGIQAVEVNTDRLLVSLVQLNEYVEVAGNFVVSTQGPSSTVIVFTVSIYIVDICSECPRTSGVSTTQTYSVVAAATNVAVFTTFIT